MDSQLNPRRIERNEAIWYANRVKGVGAAKLAGQYRLSRQRIKQIVARQDQLQEEAPGEDGAHNSGTRQADDHV